MQERVIEREGLLGERLDSGPGHHLSRHHRIRRHGQGGAHQDAPQPRGGHSETDRERPHRGAAAIVLQGRSARGGPRTGLAGGAAGPPSVPRPRPGDPLPVRGRRTRRSRATAEGYVIPVRSVGVQGDSRSYAPVLAIDALDHGARHGADQPADQREPRDRAGWKCARPGAEMRVRACSLTAGAPGASAARRRRWCGGSRTRADTTAKVWQFPVILIPLGTADAPDSVVLRPVDSVDGMTAQSVLMDATLLREMCREIAAGPTGRWRVLRSDAQAARHHRVGVNACD